MAATPAKVFGPQESRAIFERKWYRKTNDHMAKIPMWDLIIINSRDDPILRMFNWCLDAFDLVVAFETQAKELDFVMEKKPGDRDPVYLAGRMRQLVNGIVKINGENRGRRTAARTEAFDKLIDKIVMGELQGIWWTDEESVQAQVEKVNRRVGDVRGMKHQGMRHYGEFRDYATS
ncbi:uncharacterized protein RHO25_002587 [Cercospora beticola]|uniref:Uncharacterized protein n=1 Tax=Cercospora beticola TaxID=122368 RepID=A0ABZ0NEK9_CERBT|nr:hypothetical protein RHO25_002587 [Cercospora beticola]CAK1359180.1 unnamed protein product [Cercospora beticola]